MTHTNPDDAALRALFERTRSIAVVGASPKPGRASHRVMAYLQGAGFETTPIRPGGGEVLGVPVQESLAALAAPPDLVVVFRRSEHAGAVVEAAIAAGAKAVWLQDGVVHEGAAAQAKDAGLSVVMDDCALRQHRRLYA